MEKNFEDTAVTGSKVTVKVIMVVLVRINEVSVFGFIIGGENDVPNSSNFFSTPSLSVRTT